MRIAHFESLAPVCPRCKLEHRDFSPLAIGNVVKRQHDIIVEGNLLCPANSCRMEYPIIDGIPVILSNCGQYINDNFYHITVRNDLSLLTESILGDAAGPGSAFNTMRHYLSTYTWDHYGDQAPEGEFKLPGHSRPGSIVACLNAGIRLFQDKPRAPVLDVGCAAGRSTFEMAAHSQGLCLGIDLNFSLLRMAQRVMRESRVVFPLKRLGVVYDRHDYEVDFDHKEKVDFWACDALALPFENASFQFATALNVFDTVTSPRKLLVSISDVLQQGGAAILATPYDWSPPVPMQSWVGGHSQRGPGGGAGESLLRAMLAAGEPDQAVSDLVMFGEIENHPWNVRVHSRRMASYDTHILACKKSS